MTASTPRQLVLDALAATELAAYRLIPYARDPGAIEAPTIMVRVDQVDPSTEHLTRRYTFALILLTPRTDPTGPADDELDELLEDVLHALDNTGLAIVWTRATRAGFAPSGDPSNAGTPCYEVTVNVTTTHTRGT